jgi:hypothetical protein
MLPGELSMWRRERAGWPGQPGSSWLGFPVELVTTSNQLLLWEAIDRGRQDADAPQLVQQIYRRRRILQPRLLLWAGLYGDGALGLGGVLTWRTPSLMVVGEACLGPSGPCVISPRERAHRACRERPLWPSRGVFRHRVA